MITYRHCLLLAAWILIPLATACQKSGEQPLTFETVEVSRGDVTSRVTATGTLSALVTVQVGSQVSGRIKTLLADFNSSVTRGDVLATIDPQLFEAALEQARANAAAAEANLEKAEVRRREAARQLERTKALAEQQLVSASDLDAAVATAEATEAEVKVAQASLDQAKASMSHARVNLEYTSIVSPIDGVVISRSVDVGQTVAATLQAPTLFTIAEDLRKMQVDTNVSEADVGRLSAGMTATFTVDAFAGQTFAGVVRQIRNAPQTVQNVVTYDAVIDVENPRLELRPGMTATVTFITAEKTNVLRIPNSALRFRAPAELKAKVKPMEGAQGTTVAAEAPAAAEGRSGRRNGGGAADGSASEASSKADLGGVRGGPEKARVRTIWLLRDNVPTPVNIKVGISDGSLTELVEGEIKEGDKLITESSGGSSQSTQGGNSLRGMRRVL